MVGHSFDTTKGQWDFHLVPFFYLMVLSSKMMAHEDEKTGEKHRRMAGVQ